MSRLPVMFLSLALAGCAFNPEITDLDCNGLGACGASLEQEGSTWFVHADTECGVVTLETGEQLAFCGYKRQLEGSGEFGIQSCRACKRKPARSVNAFAMQCDPDGFSACHTVSSDELRVLTR